MPCSLTDSSSKRVIRKPEITKNTSTPTNPPCTPDRSAWYSTTETTAKARRPSMSGRNLAGLAGCAGTCRPDGAPSDRRRVSVMGRGGRDLGRGGRDLGCGAKLAEAAMADERRGGGAGEGVRRNRDRAADQGHGQGDRGGRVGVQDRHHHGLSDPGAGRGEHRQEPDD